MTPKNLRKLLASFKVKRVANLLEPSAEISRKNNKFYRDLFLYTGKNFNGPESDIIFVPKDLNVYKKIFKTPDAKGSQLKLLDLLAQAHEALEIKNVNKGKFNFIRSLRLGKHSSPEVLLQEHNLVTRLTGKGSEEAKKAINNLRKYNVIHELIPGYQHGISPRYSRHAVKRLSNAINRNIYNRIIKDHGLYN